MKSIGIAFAGAYFALSGEKHPRPLCSVSRVLSPLTAFPVGVGEESFFRGFLLSQFSEWLSPWGGIILSSAIFGLAHVPNGWDWEAKERREYYTRIVPLIALSGVYDGWLTYENHSLEESVAIHAWYDFVLFALGAIAGDSVFKGHSSFAVSIPF